MTPPNPEPTPEVTPQEQGRTTRRAFLLWGLGLAGGAGSIAWIRTRSLDDGIPWPLRRIHQLNERVGRALYSGTKRVREFSPALAAAPRVNGNIGRPTTDEANTIRLVIPNQAEQSLTVAQLLGGLPRVTETTEIKCIEGWSQIVTWGGVRLADALARYNVSLASQPYVALQTHDNRYYVGLDAESAFHPQTLLCDSMNGEPLPIQHGGPLRLIIPVKYGIKNIKWIGRIELLAARPADYWAERGYDWYAGL